MSRSPLLSLARFPKRHFVITLILVLGGCGGGQAERREISTAPQEAKPTIRPG